MEDFMKRLIKEKDELDTKIKSLHSFMCDENMEITKQFLTLPVEQQYLLNIQLSTMTSYSGILEMRIAYLQGAQ